MKEPGYKLLEKLADAIHKTRVEFNRLPGIKPVFRLHPPSKGVQGQGEEKLHNRRSHGLQRRKHKQPHKKNDLMRTL